MADNPHFGPAGSAAIVKRIFDIVGAASGLVLLLPLMLVLGLLLLVINGAPVLYKAERLGRDGVRFSLYKFRTLKSGSSYEPTVAPEDDPRISNAGLWLRRWRLDELPQLLNVLLGQMSLVGPRPMPPAHAASLPADQLELLLSVRPGVTDATAVYFLAEDAVLAGRSDTDALYRHYLLPAKAQMQIESLRNWSLVGDFRALSLTLVLLWSPGHRAESAKALHNLLNNKW